MNYEEEEEEEEDDDDDDDDDDVIKLNRQLLADSSTVSP